MYKYAIVHLTIKTASGAEYLLRQHGQRLYVTRLGAVAGPRLVNRITSQPVHLVDGDSMVVAFDDGVTLTTTPVVDIDWSTFAFLR